MSPTPTIPSSSASAPEDWPARQREWQRRLPRLRLQAEPVEQQVARLRRATVGISVVAGGIGLMFLVLFSAFGAPVIGLLIGGGLAFGVASPAWYSFRTTRRGADRYLQELREAEPRSERG